MSERQQTGFVQPLAPHEHWHGSLKRECIRPATPLSLEDARRATGQFVERYNNERLHSAIGFVAPKDKLEGRAPAIFAARDLKLEAARERRRLRRQAARKEEEQPATKNACFAQTVRSILLTPGKTEDGSAGEQPPKGYPGQAHRTVRNTVGREKPSALTPAKNSHRTKDLPCLKKRT